MFSPWSYPRPFSQGYRSSCASAREPPRRKIYLQEKSMRGPLLQLDQTADTGRESVFRVEVVTFLVTFVLNRRRDPRYPFGILFNLSLSLYRICPATVSTEKPSLFFIPASARAIRVYIFSRRSYFSYLKRTVLPAGWNERNFVGRSVSLGEKPFSIISEKLLNFLSITPLCEDKWIKISWRIFTMYTVRIIELLISLWNQGSAF